MSRQGHGWRTSETRDLARRAASMGFIADGLTANGHLRFVHGKTGKTVTAASKLHRLALRNAIGDLRRAARPDDAKNPTGP